MGEGDKMTLAVYIPLLSGAPVTRGTCINSVLDRAMAKLQRAGTPALEIRYVRIESIACRNGSMCRSIHWSFLGNVQVQMVEMRGLPVIMDVQDNLDDGQESSTKACYH